MAFKKFNGEFVAQFTNAMNTTLLLPCVLFDLHEARVSSLSVNASQTNVMKCSVAKRIPKLEEEAILQIAQFFIYSLSFTSAGEETFLLSYSWVEASEKMRRLLFFREEMRRARNLLRRLESVVKCRLGHSQSILKIIYTQTLRK